MVSGRRMTNSWWRTELKMEITYLLFIKLQFCLFNMPEESMNVPQVFFCWWSHYQVVCHLDKMPALASAQAGNELDALTLFRAEQTGGPAPSPVALRIWSLHEWLRRSTLHPVSRIAVAQNPIRPTTWLSALGSRLCHWAGTGLEGAGGAPIHLPQEPDDGSIGCPLLGSEHTQEDGLVGQLTKGGKACR